MGKGNDPNCMVSGRPMTAALGSAERDLPKTWNSDQLNITYVRTPAELEEAMKWIKHPEVDRIGLDIETTGGLKPWYGSIRLIQVGVELPEPRQFLIDCWDVDPGPSFGVLEDPRVEVVTCGGRYEQTHLHYRYGVIITNLWDVSYSAETVTKKKQDATRERIKEMIKRVEAPYKAEMKALKAERRKLDEDDPSYQQLSAEIADLENQMKEAVRIAKDTGPKPRKVAHNFRLLMRRYVGKKISKAMQTSPWDSPDLSDEQRVYAAMDVAGLLDMRRAIGRDIEEHGLQEAAAQANASVLDRSLNELRDADLRTGQFEKFARTMLFCKSIEQLDRLYARHGQMTLHHRNRRKLQEIYQRRRAQLLESSAVAA